jgi:hypothetical protein
MDGIWENSIFVIKKVLLTVITAVGLTVSSTTPSNITPTNISNNTISKETTALASKASKEIINNLNNSNSTLNGTLNGTLTKLTHAVIPETANQSKFKIKKLNILSLIAKDHQPIDGNTQKTNINNSENTAGSTKNYIDEYKNIIDKLSPSKTAVEQNEKINIKNTNTEDSVVNIRCESVSAGKIKVITGSGTVISNTGAILTAAHVAAPVYAQSLGHNYKCFAKIKNPASGEYPITVVFIHPNWISKHFNEFDKGYLESGEFDFAVLKLNIKKEDPTIRTINLLSRSTPSFVDSNISDLIKIVAYPADSYSKNGVFSILPRKTEGNSVKSLLTLNNGTEYTYNLIETETSSMGQYGASGGGVFDTSGNLIAVISNTVSTKENSVVKNKIRAVSVKYINSELKKHTGKSILDF